MKLANKWSQISVIPATLTDPTAVLGVNDGKLYITYDVDNEPAEKWLWTPVSLKVEEL